jgi:hypothetical protein
MRPIQRLIPAILLLSLIAPAQEPKSPLDSVEFLAGHWQGATHGEPGDGTGERNYEFVLRGKFLGASNRTVYPEAMPLQNEPRYKRWGFR